jgi:hypothetical protein
MHGGDWLVYYSSKTRMDETGEPLQAFTAIGKLADDELFEHTTASGFTPWRRQVDYVASHDAAIRPLLDRLSFTAGKQNWGYTLRYGLLPITAEDFKLIADAMGAQTTGS